ncbi:cation-dependent mannose-6-phosphate receptor-like [Montipora foliosa]|uniref:cation-dependent mannose-6-phosphate receptor-like n=1 Tax=Montipora foliosa TaxID=591990 RepID=UPI0035F19C77
MNIFLGFLKAFVVCLSLLAPAFGVKCPKHQGSDPNDVNTRIQKLANQDIYYANDDDYKYKIAVCQRNTLEQAAVQQMGLKWKPDRGWLTVGTYPNAHVTGGTDWLMVKYFGGEKYHTHCSGVGRMAIVLVTCDPGTQRGSIKVIEEYRNGTKGKDDPMECYYLFELNHDAACTEKAKQLSPGSIMLIILLVVGLVYLILGFLYQRFMAGAKGLEQIPNYDFWKDCGSLQADGCNYMCRCSEAHPTRYKAMDDALADDDRDDTLLPM